MTPQQIIDAWNAQADEANQWGALGEDEKLMWAYKQAIAEAEKQEPVACSDERPCLPCYLDTGDCLASPPQRQPLTDEQIHDMRANRHWLTAKDKAPYLAGIRDAEAAHGIKGEA